MALLKNTFLTEMTPSIVITDPVPLWKVWVRRLFKFCVVVALCVVSFYAGRYYQPTVPDGGLASSTEIVVDGVPQQPVSTNSVTANSNPAATNSAATTATSTASTPAMEPSVNNPVQVDGTQPVTDLLASHSVENLQIQNLQIKRNPATPGQLLYSFEVVNGGRLFDGHYEILALGMKEGHPEQRSIQVGGPGADRLRVARYLKQEGNFMMPEGLQVQAVVLSLHEPQGVRASRGLEIK